jgi:hypothetical protein
MLKNAGRPWHPDQVSHARLAVISGLVLLAAAVVLSGGPFGDYAGASMPYQDPTPEMLHKQAAEVAALRHDLVTRLQISALAGPIGLTALSYGLWTWRNNRRSSETGTDQ